MASTTDPDPAPKPKRRTFSPEYKVRIVAEYDAAPTGEKGAILRRERLYHSHIIEWRQARDAGGMATLTDRRTSPARPKKAAEQAELERLRKKVTRLEKDVAQRDAALAVLGKAHALLEMLSESAD
ncbi:transposase [Kitasatospora sp. McL0602]|uniref:transposase n=1 Tax=Kitasatospora sp. McL0602 TaxID=3439530 RepID=UPI003F8CC709